MCVTVYLPVCVYLYFFVVMVNVYYCRVWQVKDSGQCCMLMLPERPDLAGHHWTCFIFSLIEKTRVSKFVLVMYGESCTLTPSFV